MTDTSPLLRCRSCGWVHFGVPIPEPANEQCFKCRRVAADCEQLRALLAAKIIGVLEDRKLTVRAAQEVTGVAAADFSRIRKANLGRFTIYRLMAILSGLGQEVEVLVKIRPRCACVAMDLHP